jgi:tRNA A-37 threonylcarbamoyl transferase component Bud32
MDTESRFFFNNKILADSEESIIAEGGTAINYKVKIDGKWYCKKQLKAEYKDNPLYRDALKKEYELGASLNNDFIVHYKDMDEDENGLYLLTEFVDGGTLSGFINSNPDYFKSKSARRQFVNEILSAVGCMHHHQILHLDLKPGNIMITRIGQHVKLIDCGFAYQDSFVYIPGGTDGYSAPEQFNNKYAIGTYSDIYAIGNLFKKYGLVDKRVISRCLQEDPTKRFQSVSELRNAVFTKKKTLLVTLLIISLLISLFCGLHSYCNRKIPARYSTKLLPIDSTSNVRVKTIILDSTSQPPLIGGFIENYNEKNIINKGLIVATDTDELYDTDTTNNKMTVFETEGFAYGGANILNYKKFDFYSLDKEQFTMPLMHLIGDKNYYVKAFAVTTNNKYVYGKPILIHTKDFKRYSGSPDIGNVFYFKDYTLFDIITDEIIDLKKSFCYYTSNESPRECIRSIDVKKTGYYKLKTRWNYQVWYSYIGANCPVWKSYDTRVRFPIITYKNGMLYILKDKKETNAPTTFYYTINGDWQRPEKFKRRYTGPIKINHPCLVTCYAKRSDGAISFTNSYMVMKSQINR